MVTRRNAGFTLIELLVVIAIIAILVGILFPVISGAREKSRQAKCRANMMQLVTAMRAYRTDYGTYPPIPYYDDALDLYVGGLSALYPDYVSSADTLICPNDASNLRGLSGVPRNYCTYNGLISGIVDNGLSGDDFWRFAELDGTGQYPSGNAGSASVPCCITYNWGGYNNYAWDTTSWQGGGWVWQDPVTGPAPSFLTTEGKKWRHYPRLVNRRAPDNTIVCRCRAHHKQGGNDEAETTKEPQKWRDMIVRVGGDSDAVDYHPWTEPQSTGASQWKIQK